MIVLLVAAVLPTAAGAEPSPDSVRAILQNHCQPVRTAAQLDEELDLEDELLESQIEQLSWLRQRFNERAEVQLIIRRDVFAKPELDPDAQAQIAQAITSVDAALAWEISALEAFRRIIQVRRHFSNWSEMEVRSEAGKPDPQAECVALWTEFREQQHDLLAVRGFFLNHFDQVARTQRLFDFEPNGRLLEWLDGRSGQPESQSR